MNGEKYAKQNLIYEFSYIFFPPTWLENPCRDLWTKEYTECRLTSYISCGGNRIGPLFLSSDLSICLSVLSFAHALLQELSRTL